MSASTGSESAQAGPEIKSSQAPEAEVLLDTVKLYYEESKAARERVEGLVDKYRANTSTLLAIATAAVAFFGFSQGPRQAGWYIVAAVSYGVAVAIAFWIYAPIPVLFNVAYDTEDGLFASPDHPLTPEEIYYGYAVGHQVAINDALKIVRRRLGLANRFRALIVAIAVLVIAASLSVSLGSKPPAQPTHIIVERTQQ